MQIVSVGIVQPSLDIRGAAYGLLVCVWHSFKTANSPGIPLTICKREGYNKNHRVGTGTKALTVHQTDTWG